MADESQVGIAEPIEDVKLQEPEQNQKPKRQPRYNVILWDDQEHTVDYVVALMRQHFGYSAERGYQIAMEVNSRGRAIVLTTTKEHAELKRDQIHAFGRNDAICGSKGAMSASIEPVPE